VAVVVSGWMVEAILLVKLRKLEGRNGELYSITRKFNVFYTVGTPVWAYFSASRYTNTCTGLSQLLYPREEYYALN
jgi:hypothetical protein